LDILVRTHAPSSVAILGCAGGNGFERLIDTSVSRVVGVDINPQYIEEARQRYDGRVPGLKLLVGDIQTSAWLFEPVDFIYAALVFEYVDVARTMSVLRRHCNPKGILAVLSQVPHETLPEVSSLPVRQSATAGAGNASSVARRIATARNASRIHDGRLQKHPISRR
jgi:trans-aconitate methyltransferase